MMFAPQSRCPRTRPMMFVICCSLVLCWLFPPASAWSLSLLTAARCQRTTSVGLYQSGGGGVVDDDIARLQRKARLELEKAKAKLQAASAASMTTTTTATVVSSSSNKDEDDQTCGAPFFASVDATTTTTTTTSATSSTKQRSESVIKSINQETGLFVVDGEKMAALSETEQWERRSLSQVFDKDETVSSTSSLADRDVAASIYNLRKQLQTADFLKIFDSKNRFIGETD